MYENANLYTEEQLRNIAAYVTLLQSVRARLLAEGYDVEEMRRRYYEEKGDIMAK